MALTTVHHWILGLSADDREVLETYRPLNGSRIVLTGKLAHDLLREDLAARLYKWGGVIEDRVTAATDVLLAVDPMRMTQKRKDASAYSVTVLDEDRFCGWLERRLEAAHVDAERLGALSAPIPPPSFFAPGPEPDYEDPIEPLANFRRA